MDPYGSEQSPKIGFAWMSLGLTEKFSLKQATSIESTCCAQKNPARQFLHLLESANESCRLHDTSCVKYFRFHYRPFSTGFGVRGSGQHAHCRTLILSCWVFFLSINPRSLKAPLCEHGVWRRVFIPPDVVELSLAGPIHSTAMRLDCTVPLLAFVLNYSDGM